MKPVITITLLVFCLFGYLRPGQAEKVGDGIIRLVCELHSKSKKDPFTLDVDTDGNRATMTTIVPKDVPKLGLKKGERMATHVKADVADRLIVLEIGEGMSTRVMEISRIDGRFVLHQPYDGKGVEESPAREGKCRPRGIMR